MAGVFASCRAMSRGGHNPGGSHCTGGVMDPGGGHGLGGVIGSGRGMVLVVIVLGAIMIPAESCFQWQSRTRGVDPGGGQDSCEAMSWLQVGPLVAILSPAVVKVPRRWGGHGPCCSQSPGGVILPFWREPGSRPARNKKNGRSSRRPSVFPVRESVYSCMRISSILIAASDMGVPGPKMAAAPSA